LFLLPQVLLDFIRQINDDNGYVCICFHWKIGMNNSKSCPTHLKWFMWSNQATACIRLNCWWCNCVIFQSEIPFQAYGRAKRTIRPSTVHPYKTCACYSVVSACLFGTIWTKENVRSSHLDCSFSALEKTVGTLLLFSCNIIFLILIMCH
jgi:hypothetical protein